MDAYRTIIEDKDSDTQWDDFLAAIDGAHHEQSTCWAKVKSYQGWQSVRIRVLKGDEWIAGAQILLKKIPLVGFVGYLSSGPFYTQPDRGALEALFSAINQYAKKKRIQYIAITPYVSNEDLEKTLEKYGYQLTKEKLPPTTTTKATLILDLQKNNDELLMDMRRETRREIKLAEKSDLVVCEGSRKDLSVLFNLMKMVAERRGDSPNPGSANIFENIWDVYETRQFVKLLLIELDGEIVSIGIIFTFGNTVRFWKYGWSGTHSKKYPNQLLYWELIKWSKNNGFRYFDIVQVDSIVTDHLAAGKTVTDEIKSRFIYGPTLYKLGFGGNVVKFSGPWFRFSNPLIRLVYRHFGQAIVKTRFAKKITSRLS